MNHKMGIGSTHRLAPVVIIILLLALVIILLLPYMGVCNKCNRNEAYNHKIMAMKGGNLQACPDIDITSKLYQMGELTENSDLAALQYQAGGPQWNNQYDAKWRGMYYSNNVPQRAWHGSWPPEPDFFQGGDQPMTPEDEMIAEEMRRLPQPSPSNRISLDGVPPTGNTPAGGQPVPPAMLPYPKPRELERIPRSGPPAGFETPQMWQQPQKEKFENPSYGVPLIGGYGGHIDNTRAVHETRPVSKATNGSMHQHPMSVSGDNNPLSLDNIPSQARGIL